MEEIQELASLNRINKLLNEAQRMGKMGAWEMDVASGEVYWSDQVYRIHEVEKNSDVNLNNAVMFYHPDDRPKIIQGVTDAIRLKREYDLKARLTTAKGNQLWVRATCIPIIDNDEVVRLVGMFQDITREEEDKESIRRQEKFSKQLLDNMLEGFSVVDTNGIQLSVNKSFVEMVGYSESELIGCAPPHPYWPEEEIVKISSSFEEMVERGVGSYELVFKKKSGERFPVLVNASSITDDKGKIINYFANIVDISEIEQHKKELKSILEITQDQNERLKNFASIVSHNLRSHVAGIAGLLELIQSDDSELMENQYMKLLHQSVVNMSNTVEDLTEVANTSLTSHEKMELVNLKEIISRVVSGLESIIQINNIEIELSIPSDLVISTIPAYLESILLNLVTNSIKYRSHDNTCKIMISGHKKDSLVVLEVRDNGLGIDMKKFGSKIFGMYNTFHNNKDSRGVGLYITKNQVESMGGKIFVDSEPGIGSTFTLHFPNPEKKLGSE